MKDSLTPTNLALLMEELQSPEAYPHPVESIHLIQTHVSCVFLTGEYVYKIKKPVDFGFLDYSSLEQRHRCCEEEVRLNRRLCPDLYLAVVPITRQEGRLQFEGSGKTVEWAVQMKQLREEEMLPKRLQNGTVGKQEMERLAHRLAAFHRRASDCETIHVYGLPAIIADTMTVTLQTMDSAASGLLSEPVRRAVRKFLIGFLWENLSLFYRRAQEGRIRDCHGDLRAQNICLDSRYDEGLQVFDCIEFNDSFRYIDVAADLAYLIMDLDLAGRSDLSRCLLEAYRRETDDPALLEVLPYYLAYRAVVRGNIAMLAAAESEIPEPERQAQRDIASAAYDLALFYAHLRPHPALFITVAFSGAGKSVLARELARRLPAIHLSSDLARKEQANMTVDGSLPPEQYTAARRAAVYETLRQRAADVLQAGQNVILDATFLDPKEQEAAACLAREHQAEFWILECRCPDAVIRQRLQSRRADPNGSDAGLAVYEQQRSAFADPEKLVPRLPPGSHHLVVDTEPPGAQSAHRVVQHFLETDP